MTFKNEQNKEEYAWATSWGVSTRLIGGLIMTHSDDNGLVLPAAARAHARRHRARWGRTTRSADRRIAAAEKLAAELRGLPRDEFFGYEPITVKIDTMFDKQPGFRYAEYEVRGVPVRVEIGPKDIEKSACAVARRDVPGKEGKQFGVPLDGRRGAHRQAAPRHPEGALRPGEDVPRCADRDREHARRVQGAVPRSRRGGRAGAEPLKFVYAHWDGTRETEDRVQKEYKATIRCLPFDGPQEAGHVHLHRQAVGAPRGVRAGVLSHADSHRARERAGSHRVLARRPLSWPPATRTHSTCGICRPGRTRCGRSRMVSSRNFCFAPSGAALLGGGSTLSVRLVCRANRKGLSRPAAD